MSFYSENGHTPLHVAVLMGHKRIVELLMEGGAEVNACTKVLYSPVHIAADSGSLQVSPVSTRGRMRGMPRAQESRGMPERGSSPAAGGRGAVQGEGR